MIPHDKVLIRKDIITLIGGFGSREPMKPIKVFYMIGIYKITSPSNRVYIGQSVDIEKRFYTYRKLLCSGQKRLYNSFLKHGVEKHIFEVIEECSIDMLNERERYWQEFYDVLSKKGLNSSYVSTKVKKQVHSIETRLKMSEKLSGINNPMYGRRGNKNPNFGKQLTQERKNNISKSLLGNKPWNKGVPMSEEQKLKLSKSKIGLITGEKHYMSKKVIDLVYLKVYNSISELCAKKRWVKSTVYGMLDGSRPNKTRCVYLDKYIKAGVN